MARVPIRIITRLGHSHSGGPSAAPKITTGIEHATALKKVRKKSTTYQPWFENIISFSILYGCLFVCCWNLSDTIEVRGNYFFSACNIFD